MTADCRRIAEALKGGRSLNDKELAHLEVCDPCRRLVRELDRLDSDLESLRPPTPEGLDERVSAGLRDRPEPVGASRKARAWRVRPALVAAASLVLVTVLAFNLRDAVMRGIQKRAMGDMRPMAIAVESYSIDKSRYPSGTLGKELAERLPVPAPDPSSPGSDMPEMEERFYDQRWAEDGEGERLDARLEKKQRSRESHDARLRDAEESRSARQPAVRDEAFRPGGRGDNAPVPPTPVARPARARALSPKDDGAADHSSGAIVGTVVDQDGKPYGFVDVFVESMGGTYQQADLADDEGRFSFEPVPTGDYKLYAYAAGFVSPLFEGVSVTPDRTLAYQITLQPAGGLVENMRVDARNIDMVDTKKTDNSMTLAGEFIETIPLQNKRIQDTVALSAGVIRTGSSDSDDISVAGGNTSGIGFRLNGISVNDPIDGGAVLDISTGAIQDFKPITGGNQAEYGEKSAAVSGVTRAQLEDRSEGVAAVVGESDAPKPVDVRGEPPPQSGGKMPLKLERNFNFVTGQAVEPATVAPEPRPAGAELLGESNEAVAEEQAADKSPAERPANEAGSYANFLAQMGYGALGYESADWQGVSLDRPVYFENTYLGGNARLAWLDRRASPLRLDGAAVAPHRAVCWPEQPFDAPERGAVSLQVDASEAHVPAGEPRRVFLQVGIAGTDDAAWRRPPASVVVLPLLATASDAELQSAVGTLRAGLEARDLISVVGVSDGLFFAAPSDLAAELSSLGSHEAGPALRRMAREFAKVETGAALRTRRLVILADAPLDEDLRRQVHALALEDVVSSVVSIGALSDETIETHARIAQAGQGNLHLVGAGGAVDAAISDELDSLTRVVARALRLNIRPAEGVRLIQVLGSRPLGRREVKEVKAREEAVDRAVERTTGIASDRGNDDPGLQTVMPYFLAGDRHLVIVEFEVSGPGSLADVSLKMKDLVEMQNSTLHASVALSRTPAERSPRQVQVSRNVGGFVVAKILRDAESDLVAGGSGEPARLRWLAEQLLAEPLLSSVSDARLLETYARILLQSNERSAIAASLQSTRLSRLGRGLPSLESR